MAASHDPIAFVRELMAQQAAGRRHVCALLGAGASRAAHVPDLAELGRLVESGLVESRGEGVRRHLVGPNLEAVLTRLRRIVDLVEVGHEYDGLDAETAALLERAATQQIIKAIVSADLDPTTYLGFAQWAARQERTSPVELFTLNYDLLLEAALDLRSVPYFDGFVGQLAATFRPDLVEGTTGMSGNVVPPWFIRVWKLHGSINWAIEELGPARRIVRLGVPAGADQIAAIYPSEAKYTESRRVPFVVLHDRLRRSLAEPETLVIVAGYSFGDDHVNETVFESARRYPRSTYVVFCHGEIPRNVVEVALSTPNLIATSPEEAIMGTVRGAWIATGELRDVYADGRFLLGDFDHLSAFLGRSMDPGNGGS